MNCQDVIVVRGDCVKYSEKIRLLPFIKVAWAREKKKKKKKGNVRTEIDAGAAAVVFRPSRNNEKPPHIWGSKKKRDD